MAATARSGGADGWDWVSMGCYPFIYETAGFRASRQEGENRALLTKLPKFRPTSVFLLITTHNKKYQNEYHLNNGIFLVGKGRPLSMVQVGGASLPGSRYGVLNQDYALVDSFQGCRFALVLDGHGMLGEKAAHHAAMAMSAALKSSALRSEKLDSLAHDTLQAVMRDIFIAGHAAVLDLYDKPPQFYNYPLQSPDQKRYALSKHADFQVYTHPTTGPRLLEFGTTATLVLVQDRTVIVAHVGDSLVAIGRRWTSPQGGEDGQSQTEYDGEFLTREHNGLDPEERHRLAEYAGKSMIVRAKDGYISITSLPPPMGVFSLSMSRALGHQFMSDYGVIPDPVTVVYRVRSEDLVLIAATDGVWEGLSAKAAVELTVEALSEGRSPDGVAHALCRESIEAVVKSGKSVRADNTSAVVFIFEHTDNNDAVINVERNS